jgi:hypothetical protein
VAPEQTCLPFPILTGIRRLGTGRRRGGRRRARRLRFETCQPRELLAGDVSLTGAPFQNQTEPLDVNGDGWNAEGWKALLNEMLSLFAKAATDLKARNIDAKQLVRQSITADKIIVP